MRSCINSLAVSLDPGERKGGGWEREELINLHNQEYPEEVLHAGAVKNMRCPDTNRPFICL